MTPLNLIKYEKVFDNKQIDGSKEGEKAKMAARLSVLWGHSQR